MRNGLSDILGGIARANVFSAFGGNVGGTEMVPKLAKNRNFSDHVALSQEGLSDWYSRSKEAEGMIVKSSGVLEGHLPEKEKLRQLVGKTQRYSEKIGPHPDFVLGQDETENHYVVSVFVDMQGSTALGTKFPLEQVRMIKNGLIISAIQIFQAFDGHIHRLQGDAIFAFFGRKGMPEADAIIDALNASTVLQNFCSSVLSPKFQEHGLDPLRIRIGIDYGPDDKVLWSHFGIPGCDEVTTTSIHTDLAAKMQAKAKANHIMVGDNVRELLDLPDEFHGVLMRQRDGQDDPQPFALKLGAFSYKMWKFEWEKYLKRFVIVDHPTQGAYSCPKHFSFRCFYGLEGDTGYPREYLPNCGSVPIGVELNFKLDIPANIRWDAIEWRVQNRGTMASARPDRLEYAVKVPEKQTYCLRDTAYIGHHYMRCTIKYQGRTIAQEHFGVYVRAA